jgi:hypothetical protein
MARRDRVTSRSLIQPEDGPPHAERYVDDSIGVALATGEMAIADVHSSRKADSSVDEKDLMVVKDEMVSVQAGKSGMSSATTLLVASKRVNMPRAGTTVGAVRG